MILNQDALRPGMLYESNSRTFCIYIEKEPNNKFNPHKVFEIQENRYLNFGTHAMLYSEIHQILFTPDDSADT